MTIKINAKDLIIALLVVIICALGFVTLKNSRQQTEVTSEPAEQPVIPQMDVEAPPSMPSAFATSVPQVSQVSQDEVKPTQVPAKIVTLEQILAQPLPSGEISEECKIAPEGFCGAPAYSPWELVGCVGKPAPTFAVRKADDTKVTIKFLPCDTPQATSAWAIEPLNARARLGPGRTITDDPTEASFSKAWWVAYGRVNYGTEVEVLGCFADQTRPVWSRIAPLTAHFKEPLDVSSLNSWVFIRYKYDGGNPNDELYPKQDGYAYAWVHNITLSKTFINFIPVCKNYIIQ